jgi:ferric-dicitrate binding protein FerR (iron transport regulator)
MTPEKLDEILKRYEQDACTPEERAFVEAWYNNLHNGAPGELANAGRGDIRSRIRGKLEAHIEDPGNGRRLGLLGISFRIAAGLALLAVTFFVFRGGERATPEPPAVVTPGPRLLSFANTGSVLTKVMLNDGSIVTLRPQSEIKYPVTFTALREVYLSGEAFFDVKRDEHRPFLVYAKDVTTKVLGTSFLVTAYPHDAHTTVAVKTGRVAVFKPKQDRITPQTGHEVVLTPNQEAVYSKINDALVTQAVTQPAALVFPPAQKVRYEAAPVTQVLEDLIKTYGVDIRYNAANLADYTLTTTLSEESLDNRIGIICKAIGATCQVQGGVISVNVPERPKTEPQ